MAALITRVRAPFEAKLNESLAVTDGLLPGFEIKRHIFYCSSFVDSIFINKFEYLLNHCIMLLLMFIVALVMVLLHQIFLALEVIEGVSNQFIQNFSNLFGVGLVVCGGL